MARNEGKVNLKQEDDSGAGSAEDAQKTQQALAASEKAEAEAAAKAMALKAELAKIKVDPADVTYLVNELEITKEKADQLLREHKNNVKELLLAFVNPV